MRLSSAEFDGLDYQEKLRVINSHSILVSQRSDIDGHPYLLYSLFHFFIETSVNHGHHEYLKIQRLSLEEVVDLYCRNIIIMV